MKNIKTKKTDNIIFLFLSGHLKKIDKCVEDRKEGRKEDR